MKSYTLPAVILLAVSALLALCMLRSFRSAGQAASALAEAKITVAGDSLQLASTQVAARKDAADAEETDRFLEKWTAELNSEANIEEILGRLDTLAVNGLLSPAGKNFKLNSNYPFKGRRLAVQTVNIAVAGDFYRTLNWLGEAEQSYPLARVEQISYTNSGSALALAVQLSFPRKFDAQ